ncbi:MAG TPA: hypothetical protein VMT85_04425 [Thermoanaerobaculia bacterium]|nr:hypothetical protein [Thermoanaerobaculia bacterium]
MEKGSRNLSTRTALWISLRRFSLLLGATAILGCGAEGEAPDGSTESLTDGSEPSSLASPDPASWSCHRYGDIADASGDSYDSNAVRVAERYLEETMESALKERGLPVEEGEQARSRWSILLAEICVEWPDLPLEVAAQRVAEELP